MPITCVRLSRSALFGITKAARQAARLECCGLLAGHTGAITHAFAATNVATDPARNYEIAPKEIVRLMRELRTQRLEFLGI